MNIKRILKLGNIVVHMYNSLPMYSNVIHIEFNSAVYGVVDIFTVQ